MDINLIQIINEFDKLKGQFVITASHMIERLVAIGDDGEDYYYITYTGREFKWYSCVGRVMPLKGYLIDEDYNELVRLANLNHYDKLNWEMFIKAFESYTISLSPNHKFHTEFYFELEKINTTIC
jgi:hypothetical protein